MLTESLIRKNCFCDIFENANLLQLCASKIWHYNTVCEISETFFGGDSGEKYEGREGGREGWREGE